MINRVDSLNIMSIPDRPKPTLIGMPDEILLEIAKAHGCSSDFTNDDHEVIKLVKSLNIISEETAIVKEFVEDVVPQLKSIAQVCRKLRDIYLQAFPEPTITEVFLLEPTSFHYSALRGHEIATHPALQNLTTEITSPFLRVEVMSKKQNQQRARKQNNVQGRSTVAPDMTEVNEW